MKNTQRFDDAYNSLVEAYFKGTLAKGNCCACAVGNICKVPAQKLGVNNWIWNSLFYTSSATQLKGDIYAGWPAHEMIYKIPNRDRDFDRINAALELIKETGYSMEELAEIEFAFETNTKIMKEDYHEYSEQEILEDQYNGLKAVVDVMCKLDGIEQVEEKQQKFREHPKLVTV